METLIKDYVIINLETNLIHLYYKGEEFVFNIEQNDNLTDYWNRITLSNGEVYSVYLYYSNGKYIVDIYKNSIDNSKFTAFVTLFDITIIK